MMGTRVFLGMAFCLCATVHSADMHALVARLDALENEVAILRNRVHELERRAADQPQTGGMTKASYSGGNGRLERNPGPPRAAPSIVPVKRHSFFVTDHVRIVTMPDVPDWWRAGTSLAVGYAHRLGQWHLGAALIVDDRHTSFYNTNSYSASLFWGMETDSGWYAKAMVAGGFNADPEFDMLYGLPKMKARDDGSFLAGASVEGGKRFEVAPGFFVKPYIGFDSGLEHSRASAFNAAGQKIVQARFRNYSSHVVAGATLKKEFAFGNWSFSSLAGIAMMQPLNGDGGYGFMTHTGDRWKALGGGGDSGGGELRLGLDAAFKSRFILSINGTYTGWKDFDEIGLSSSLAMRF